MSVSQRVIFRSSRLEVFLGKGVLKICGKFTGEHPWLSVISIKLLCNFMEITLRHGCSPVNSLHIFRTRFLKNTCGRLLLFLTEMYGVRTPINPVNFCSLQKTSPLCFYWMTKNNRIWEKRCCKAVMWLFMFRRKPHREFNKFRSYPSFNENNKSSQITHLIPLVFFYTHWKHQKISAFLMFSEGVVRDQVHEMN